MGVSKEENENELLTVLTKMRTPLDTSRHKQHTTSEFDHRGNPASWVFYSLTLPQALNADYRFPAYAKDERVLRT